MSTAATLNLDRLLEPLTGCLSRDVAAKVADLRADAEMQARIDYLADRATVELLSMNHWERVELRENLQSLGEPFAG